jgi:tetrapyrrole methylase family protein/MazG family protein
MALTLERPRGIPFSREAPASGDDRRQRLTQQHDKPESGAPNAFGRLLAIMARLRGPDGCPWDREQDHRTLTPYLIEEAYEVKEALDRNDFPALREELGDLLLQIVFHAQLAEEADRFNAADVIEGLCSKLVRRHPHVFGDISVADSGEVLRNWESIKKTEKRGTEAPKQAPSVLAGVPSSLPALLKAHRIQQKAAGVGFDWPEVGPIWDKIREETDELRAAVQSGAPEQIAEEFGDLLFSIVNLSRRMGIPAEEALEATNRKFMERFRRMEQALHDQGKQPTDLTLEQLDVLWEAAKSETRR